MRERLNPVPPWLPAVQFRAVAHSQEGWEEVEGRHGMLLFHSLHHGLGEKWLEKKQVVLCYLWGSASSLHVHCLDPYFTLITEWVGSSEQIHLTPSMLMGAPTLFQQVLNGIQHLTVCIGVCWLGIANEWYPIERHQQFGSSASLIVDQKGVPDPMCGFESLKWYHFTSSKMGTMKDFLM